MDKDNKLMKNIAWGISAFIGFVVAEKIYSASVKKIEEEKDLETIELIEEESE